MLELPTTPAKLLREVVVPALAILPLGMDSPAARCLILAICKQESNLEHRRQVSRFGHGPARGLAQFERIGVVGVLQHRATDDLAAMVCRHHGLPVNATRVHHAMETNDELAVQFSRLNLYTYPKALPKPVLSAEDEAFAQYVAIWRPGAASTPEGYVKCAARWRSAWKLAVQAVG